MSQAPPTRRRWFQFGIGTMLWLMLVVALVLFAVNERRERMRERAASEAKLEAKLHEARIEAQEQMMATVQSFNEPLGDISVRSRNQQELRERLKTVGK